MFLTILAALFAYLFFGVLLIIPCLLELDSWCGYRADTKGKDWLYKLGYSVVTVCIIYIYPVMKFTDFIAYISRKLSERKKKS